MNRDSLHSNQGIPTLNSPLSEIDLLGVKLQEEIAHLERWMASQKENNHKSSSAIVNTIEGLIETRKRLLTSIQKTGRHLDLESGEGSKEQQQATSSTPFYAEKDNSTSNRSARTPSELEIMG